MRTRTSVLATLAALMVGWSGVAAAAPAFAAPPKCSDLNGAVDAKQMCQITDGDTGYTMHIAYPTMYPDVQGVFDYIKQTRDGFLNVAERFVPMTEVRLTSAAHPELDRDVPILAVRRDRAQVMVLTDADADADTGTDAPTEADHPGEGAAPDG